MHESSDLVVDGDGENALSLTQQRRVDACYRAILPSASVTAHDSFFDLGGDSIQLVKLVQLVQKEFDVSIRLSDFLYNPTRSALTEAISAGLRGGAGTASKSGTSAW